MLGLLIGAGTIVSHCAIIYAIFSVYYVQIAYVRSVPSADRFALSFDQNEKRVRAYDYLRSKASTELFHDVSSKVLLQNLKTSKLINTPTMQAISSKETMFEIISVSITPLTSATRVLCSQVLCDYLLAQSGDRVDAKFAQILTESGFESAALGFKELLR